MNTGEQGRCLDVLIVGAGPAGLSCAIALEALRLNWMLVEKSSQLGGELLRADDPVVDVPGMLSSNGKVLTTQLTQHLRASGPSGIVIGCEVVSIEKKYPIFILKTNQGREFEAKSVVLCTGTRPRQHEVPNIPHPSSHMSVRDRLEDFSGKAVAVIGAGDEASELAVRMSEAGSIVTLLARSNVGARPRFRNPLLESKVCIKTHTTVETCRVDQGGYILGLSSGDTQRFDDVITRIGSERCYPKMIGFSQHPIFNQQNSLDLGLDNHGIFAAGDVNSPMRNWYAANAIAQGVLCGRMVEEYLDSFRLDETMD
jgi:thioredoxin reductase